MHFDLIETILPLILYQETSLFFSQVNPPKSPQCNFLKRSILSNSSLKAIGCYPLKDNLTSLITFQEMNNVVHQELNTLQNLGIPMTIQ